MKEAEVTSLIQELRSVWVGTEYEILTRNCCHFSDAFCRRLGVGPAPVWLMHLAGAGVTLVNGVEKAVMHTHSAVTLAAEKAGELDDHYRFSERAGEFLSREVNIDENYLGARAQEVFEKALEHLAPVGELAERVIDEAMKPMSPTRTSLRVSPGALFRWWPATDAAQEASFPAMPDRHRTGLPTLMESTSPGSAETRLVEIHESQDSETQLVEIEEIKDLQDPESLSADSNDWHDLAHGSQTALLEVRVADERDPADTAETFAEAAATAAAEAPATLLEVWPPLRTISESAWPLPLPGIATGSTLKDGMAGEDLVMRGELNEEQPDEEEADNKILLEEAKNAAGKELQEVQGEHESDSASDVASPKIAGAHLRPLPVVATENEDSDPDTCRV